MFHAVVGNQEFQGELMMSNQRSATVVMDSEYLKMRSGLLEVAAALDRLERAPGGLVDDPRRNRLEQAIQILHDSEQGRAERLQLLFSRPFNENWKQEFGID